MEKQTLQLIFKGKTSLKMHQKMLVLMFSTFSLLIVIFCSIILYLFHNNELDNQFEQCKNSNAQILTAFEYISDDMERHVGNTSKAEGLPSIVKEAVSDPLQEYRVKHIMKVIVDTSSYFEDIFLVDIAGKFYFLTDSTQEEYYLNLWESGVFYNTRHIFYAYDSEGNSYLCRKIFSTYPSYEVVCTVVVKLDVQFIYSLLCAKESGAIAILDHTYQPIIRITGTQDETELLESTIQDPNKLNIQQSFFHDFHIFSLQAAKEDWNIIRVVSDKNLASTYYKMRDGIYTVVALCALAMLVLCYYLSYYFTKSIRQLVGHVKKIGTTEQDVRIPEESKDNEIFELSKSINLMLDCIDNATNTYISEVKAKQRIQYELLDFKCKLLQAQVSPHFICNILTAILSFSEEGDHSKVESLTVLASEYLRNNLNSTDRQITTIDQEFLQISNYLRLFHMVYATEIDYNVFCSPEAENTIVPNSLLISLVENSLKHGTKGICNEPFRIEITASVMEGKLCISVTDSGVGFSQEVLSEIEEYVCNTTITPKLLGFGISSVIRRLELQHSKSYKFVVFNTKPTGSTIHIEIPLQYSDYKIMADLLLDT